LSIKFAFFTSQAVVYTLLNLALAIFVINWTRPTSIVLYALLSVFILSSSFIFTERLFSLFLPPYRLPKSEAPPNAVRVAILYTTMNDVLPECLSGIRQDHPCDVYVLDDSTDYSKRKLVDQIALRKGFVVLRRENRKGFKAGAVNNWIWKYGEGYNYVVILDSDSYLPTDWVREALRYAEHPANRGIAIFQGLINLWNLENRFVRTLAPLHRVGQDVWELRMANYLDAVFCYGHNVMIRMSALREIGGFVENYVSEDFATAVKLAESGYSSRFVPLHTYEALPENIRGFIRRQNRWTKGSMEFFDFIRKGRISVSKKFILSRTPLGHISYIFILIAMMITIFGYASDYGHAAAFAENLLASPVLYLWSIPLFRYVIVTGILFGILFRIKLRQAGIGEWTYLKYQFLSKAIGSIMLPYEVKSILSYVLGEKRSFPVTPKHERSLSLIEVLSISRTSLFLMTAFTAGIIYMNPLAVFYNISWLFPFFISPTIIYMASKTSLSGVLMADGGSEDNGNSASEHNSITCLRSQPELVAALLMDAKRSF